MNNKEEAIKMLEEYVQEQKEGRMHTRGAIIGFIFGILFSSPCILASFCGIFADDYLNSPEKYKVDTTITIVNSVETINYHVEKL